MDPDVPSTGAPLPDPLRAAVRGADHTTGEIKAAPRTAAALVKHGLAVRYGAAGRHYLTDSGRALRTALRSEPAEQQPQPEGVFTAVTGDESSGAAELSESRTAEVAAAWAGVLGMRHLEMSASTPCTWERAQPVRAVAIALEAAGIRPAARDGAGRWLGAGYRVLPEPGGARVEWRGPASSPARQDAERELDRCAAVLSAAGWSCLQYLGRQHLRYLSVQPHP
ncbi:hypothetical protein [Streptacidiphilus jiangxiensis]|uniref:Uncharacterized protein n=1 Tax=Streptacidiphilus jiangxiensis TaxID=235985 RepID=A0A1H8BUN7_STRJI|nr:hypothetical protein [Streptacidiphilus jiangxiensis]SEM86595.1 hypothetical protein SAMN05414137_1822 [Streptacidiphilus jiangxiensis]